MVAAKNKEDTWRQYSARTHGDGKEQGGHMAAVQRNDTWWRRDARTANSKPTNEYRQITETANGKLLDHEVSGHGGRQTMHL